MASVISPIECPNCHRTATEDYYYKSEERYVWCFKCGYNYTKTIKWESAGDYEYLEEEFTGYGVSVLKKKVGRGKSLMHNGPITPEDIEAYKKEFFSEGTDQENSYLVKYEDGEFVVLFGTLPDHFDILYEEGGKDLPIRYPFPNLDEDGDW